MRRGLGFGRRSGQGPGKGYGRRGFYPGGRRWSGPAYGYGTAYDSSYPMSRGEEVNMLRDEADALSSDLNEINRRIKELEKGPAE